MKKFIQKFKPLDIAILGAILIIIVIGVLVYFGKNKIFSSSPVEFTKKIEFEVMVRGVTQTDPNIPFVTGQETFITIRNVPYTKLKITGVKYAPKQMVIPVKDGDKTLYSGTANELTKQNVIAADDTLKIGQRRNLTVVFHYPESSGNDTQNDQT